MLPLYSLLTLTQLRFKCHFFFFQRSHTWASMADSGLPTQHPLPPSLFCSVINSSKNTILKSSEANTEEFKPVAVISAPFPAFRCGHVRQFGKMTGEDTCWKLLRKISLLLKRDTLCYHWALLGSYVIMGAGPAILPPWWGRPGYKAGVLEMAAGIMRTSRDFSDITELLNSPARAARP